MLRASLVFALFLGLTGSACGDDDDEVVPGPLPDAGAQPDTGAVSDAGLVLDGGAPDGGGDAGVSDAGLADAGDAGTMADPVRFLHGVASGDPLADRVVIWTRVTPEDESRIRLDVAWEVALDRSFTNIVQQGMTETSTSIDRTVKVDVTGLSVGTTYYYRFISDGVVSPVGRTKTLPMGPVSRIRFAVVSCSNYPSGLFNVYRLIANRPDLDAVLHLGDYFYEYGAGEYPAVSVGGRDPQPPTETLSLDDYRARHAQYKADLDSQAMHGTHPLIAVWDDHESANNAWREGAQNHDPATEGAWSARRAAAIQAYYEWMPIRTPDMGGSIFRRFEFGDLATLHMIDTRLEGRDEQLDYADLDPTSMASLQQFLGRLYAPTRTLLGASQREWLLAGLEASTTRWQIIGNQVMMGHFFAPVIDNETLLMDPAAQLINQLAQLGRSLSQAALIPSKNLPFSTGEIDAWDGYPAEREALFEAFSQARNVVVLTGDFHNSYAVELAPNAALRMGGAYDPATGAGTVGVELITTSVTSPGFEDTVNPLALPLVAQVITTENQHIRYLDLSRRGYVDVTFTTTAAIGRFMFVPTITQPSTTEIVGREVVVVDGEKRFLR